MSPCVWRGTHLVHALQFFGSSGASSFFSSSGPGTQTFFSTAGGPDIAGMHGMGGMPGRASVANNAPQTVQRALPCSLEDLYTGAVPYCTCMRFFSPASFWCLVLYEPLPKAIKHCFQNMVCTTTVRCSVGLTCLRGLEPTTQQTEGRYSQVQGETGR